MENVKYLTIAELFQKLRKNPVNASQFNPNPEAPEPFLEGEYVKNYLINAGPETPVDISFFVNLLDKFFPMLENETHRAPEWLAEDLWRIGYYSDLWKIDYSVAVIVVLLGLLDLVDERYDKNDKEYLLTIRSRIEFLQKKERPAGAP